jgi:hypothetical protein
VKNATPLQQVTGPAQHLVDMLVEVILHALLPGRYTTDSRLTTNPQEYAW